jgi:hypothetical protein
MGDIRPTLIIFGQQIIKIIQIWRESLLDKKISHLIVISVRSRVSETKKIRECIPVVQVSRVDLIDFQFGCLLDYLFDLLRM